MTDGARMYFSSENFSAVHEEIMSAMTKINTGYVPSYGKDAYTSGAIELFRKHFGDDIEVHFTFNGTGANNFGIGAMVERHHAVYCSDVAHLYLDESTAPEAFIGSRIYPVRSVNGKIIPEDLLSKVSGQDDVHHPQPRVVSLTQSTECGTVYTLGEIQEIKTICVENGLLLHVDGARFFNAAEGLRLNLKQLTADAGIDILTLGGTKSGMMFGEAVIFFRPAAASANRYHLKRSMQLASKNRFIAIQFKAILENDLWKSIAGHTNALAASFSEAVSGVPGLQVAFPVESNAVFLKMPKAVYEAAQQHASFYRWNEQRNEYRIIFSFSNTMEEVLRFAALLRSLSAKL